MNKIKVISTTSTGKKYERWMPAKYKEYTRREQPWYTNWVSARNRCENKNNAAYKNYGGRGISFDMTFWQVGVLYWRDRANEMKYPTIDRINNDGNYTFANCRFIERSENRRKEVIKEIHTYPRDHKGMFVKRSKN